MIMGKEIRKEQPYWQKHLPEQWKLSRLKHCLSSLESGNREKGGGNIYKGIFSIGGEHISWSGKLKLDNPKYVTKQFFDEMKRGKVKKGDILLVKDGATIGKSVYIENSPFKDCAVNEHVFLLRSNELFHGKYVYYFIISVYGQDQILMEIRGAAQGGLSSNFANELVISHPSLPEQQAIANFLDRKTTQIDALIAKKQRLIALLQEHRTALINQAVTKGLDPHVPMKDSGIGWLGMIPKHWKITRLKFIGDAIIGLTYKPSEIVNNQNGKLVLRAGNIQNGKIVLNDNVFVNKDIPEHLITKYGDILICSRSGSRALIGKNAIIDQCFTGCTFGVFMTLFRSEINDYLFFLFNSRLFEHQSGMFMTSTINQLTLHVLNNFYIPLPPKNEQINIFDELSIKTRRIDKLISQRQQEIYLLREFRQSIIVHAVTGKIDVRDQG